MSSSAGGLLKKINIKVKRKLNTVYSGKYRSAFKGNGILFESLREYNFGDEIKSIDWNVSARSGKLHVREYTEERELNFVIACDVSASMNFGSSVQKAEAALEFAAVILKLAEYNNDSVSAALFSDSVEYFFKPKKGSRFAQRILDKMMNFSPKSRHTDVNELCRFLNNTLKKRSIVFIISDFLDDSFDRNLKILARRHQLIPVKVSDVSEKLIPFGGIIEFRDSESGEQSISDGIVPFDSDEFKYFSVLDISTDEDPLSSTVKYFEKRNKGKVSRW